MLRLPVLGAQDSVDAVVLCALLLWGSVYDYGRLFERIYDRLSQSAPPPQAIFDFEGTVTQFGFCLSTLSSESAEEVMGWLRGLADLPVRSGGEHFGLGDVGFTQEDREYLEGHVEWMRDLALLLGEYVYTRGEAQNRHLLFACTLSPEPSVYLLELYAKLLRSVSLFIYASDSLEYTASLSAIYGVPPGCSKAIPRRNRRSFETAIYKGQLLVATWDISRAGLVISNVESGPGGTISFDLKPGNVRPFDMEVVRRESELDHAAAVRLFAALALAVRARCLLKRVSAARLTGMIFEHCQVRCPPALQRARRGRSY
jgi:hypothetical protein